MGQQDLLQPYDKSRFEQLVLPHLDDAFNLARWLLRHRADSEDVVQESLLRAYRFFFDRFQGSDARAWLLRIVRNTCYSWLEKNHRSELVIQFDEELHRHPAPTPEALVARAGETQRLILALESLPARSREIIVLRELEGCSYKEIAKITGIPLGTVMSTLSLARERLRRSLTAKEGTSATELAVRSSECVPTAEAASVGQIPTRVAFDGPKLNANRPGHSEARFEHPHFQLCDFWKSPHSSTGHASVACWLWWAKSEKGWHRFGFVVAYILVFYAVMCYVFQKSVRSARFLVEAVQNNKANR